MKNKAKTYLLLVAVLGIWGTIAYKIVNGISPDEPQVSEKTFEVAFNPKPQKAIDTFSISVIERDPFLGTLSVSKKTVKPNRITESAKPDEAIPDITYGGLIQKQGSKSKVFVVNINNQQHLLKQGQSVNDVKLINGNKMSITIRFNGKNHTIKL